MRTKTVTRYYCNFCSKGMFRKSDMERHESGCTKNPLRACWLCSASTPGSRDYLALAKRLRDHKEVSTPGDNFLPEENQWMRAKKGAIEWLMSECDGCPACTLSVLRQAKVDAFEVFDYKKEMDEWRETENREF